MVCRCLSLGIDIPSESTTGHIISTLVSLAKLSLSSVEVHGLVLDFKKRLKHAWKTNTKFAVSEVVDYPLVPADLPAQCFQQAYEGSSPTKADMSIVHERVWVRRTATSLRSSSSSGIAQVPHPMEHMMQSMMQHMVMYAQGSLHQRNLQTNFQTNLPNLPNLQINRGRSRHMLALPSTEEVPMQSTQQHSPVGATLVHVNGDVSNTAAGTLAAGTGSALPSEAADVASAPRPERIGSTLFELPDAEALARIAEAASQNRKDHADLQKENNGDLPKKNTREKGVATKPKAKAKPKANAKAKGKKPQKASAAAKAAGKVAQVIKTSSKTCKDPGARPPQATAGNTVIWGGGKLQRSDRLQAWRVFIHEGDRCDKATQYTTHTINCTMHVSTIIMRALRCLHPTIHCTCKSVCLSELCLAHARTLLMYYTAYGCLLCVAGRKMERQQSCSLASGIGLDSAG
jgi:hypothetical protein